MTKFVMANVIIRGEALPMARLNFVTRITPKRRDIVFGGDTLAQALRMTEAETQEVMARCPHDTIIHAVRE